MLDEMFEFIFEGEIGLVILLKEVGLVLLIFEVICFV